MAKNDGIKFDGYDGGLSDTYDDDLPKKRGRKKKTAVQKEGKEKSGEEKNIVSDDNDDLINALINEGEVDPEMLDEAFKQYSPDIDLVCDTTGEINKLRTKLPRAADVAAVTGSEQTESGFVVKWCNKMMSKDEYTDDEQAAFDAIRELVERLGIDDE